MTSNSRHHLYGLLPYNPNLMEPFVPPTDVTLALGTDEEETFIVSDDEYFIQII